MVNINLDVKTKSLNLFSDLTGIQWDLISSGMLWYCRIYDN